MKDSLINGIKMGTVNSRLRRGWTYEEATQIPVQRKVLELNVPLYEYKGKYLSVKQIAEIYNLNYKTIHKRLQRGWNIDEAIEIPVRRYAK